MYIYIRIKKIINKYFKTHTNKSIISNDNDHCVSGPCTLTRVACLEYT